MIRRRSDLIFFLNTFQNIFWQNPSINSYVTLHLHDLVKSVQSLFFFNFFLKRKKLWFKTTLTSYIKDLNYLKKVSASLHFKKLTIAKHLFASFSKFSYLFFLNYASMTFFMQNKIFYLVKIKNHRYFFWVVHVNTPTVLLFFNYSLRELPFFNKNILLNKSFFITLLRKKHFFIHTFLNKSVTLIMFNSLNTPDSLFLLSKTFQKKKLHFSTRKQQPAPNLLVYPLLNFLLCSIILNCYNFMIKLLLLSTVSN